MFRRFLFLPIIIVTSCSTSYAPQPTDINLAVDPTIEAVFNDDPTLEAIFNESENREIYDKLDVETLATIPDDKLEQAISDYVWSKISDAPDFYKAIIDLPDGLAAFYYLDELEGEVNNGGYNQYFYNTNGDHIQQTIWALNLLDFSELTENYEKAVAIWNNEKNDPRIQSLYESGTLEDFSETYKYTDLSVCDDEFYALDTKLRAAKITFVRASPELFVDD